jgi:hypothetical protein
MTVTASASMRGRWPFAFTGLPLTQICEAADHQSSDVGYWKFALAILCLLIVFVLIRKRQHPPVTRRRDIRVARATIGAFGVAGIIWIFVVVIASATGMTQVEHYFLWILGSSMIVAFPIVYRFLA